MNNTALGAENKKKQTINFISEAHEKFYYPFLIVKKQMGYSKVVYRGIAKNMRRFHMSVSYTHLTLPTKLVV